MTSDDEIVSTEPDFSDFADWLIAGPRADWSEYLDTGSNLNEIQNEIIKNNALMLLDREAWSTKVDKFNYFIENSENNVSDFCVFLDNFMFPDGDKDFSGYEFPCSISFVGAKFGRGNVVFNQANFSAEDPNFSAISIEEGNLHFNFCAFKEGLFLLTGARIESGHLYVSDLFVSYSSQSQGETHKLYVLLNDVFVKFNLYFSSIDSLYGGDFQGIEVSGVVSFVRVRFGRIPDFSGAKFDRPPDVSGMEVLALKKNWIWPWWKAAYNESAKFRKLKAMALAANDHEKDGEFFAYEMLAKRGHEAGSTGPFALFINWLYFTFSRYGQSFKRPLVLLILSLLTGWCGYGFWIGTSLANADRWAFAFGYSFRNFLPLLGSLFRFAPQPSDHESWFDETFHELAHSGFNVDWLTHVGIVQNFFGLIFLFLLLLGLRNKFRLK